MRKLTDKVTFRHGATITTRTAQSPMLTNSGTDEFVSDDTLNYYAARSQSAGMVIVEYTNVSLSGGPSRSWPDHTQIAVYDDKFIPGLTKIATALKKDGNKAILQLCHAGREANYAQALGRTAAVPSIVEMPWIDYPLHVLTDEEVSKEVFRVVREYAPENFIVGYRISPDEIHGENIGYTWHESQKLVKKLTEDFDYDYIHISLLQYDAKPEDSDKTFCELLHEVLPEETKLLVAGSISTYDKMVDALKYVDIISMGRATLIDPRIGWKLANGKQDEIDLEFNEKTVAQAHLTDGLFASLTQVPEFAMPGTDYLKTLNSVELSEQFTHLG